MKTGIELIAQERQEQIEKHGWTLLHDSIEHDGDELVNAACAIAYDSPLISKPVRFSAPDWAWDIKEHKQRSKGKSIEKIERWKVAGALIAAAIDLEQAAKGGI